MSFMAFGRWHVSWGQMYGGKWPGTDSACQGAALSDVIATVCDGVEQQAVSQQLLGQLTVALQEPNIFYRRRLSVVI